MTTRSRRSALSAIVLASALAASAFACSSHASDDGADVTPAPPATTAPVAAPVATTPGATSNVTCLADAVVRAELAQSKNREAIHAAADHWTVSCPTSSKAWLARSIALQRAGIDYPAAKSGALKALALDEDWDTLGHDDANATLALIALVTGDRAGAQKYANSCKATKVGDACSVIHRLAGVVKAAPKPPPSSGSSSGESGAGACAACPLNPPAVLNPGYALATKAVALVAAGDTYQAYWAAHDCRIWAETLAAPPGHPGAPSGVSGPVGVGVEAGDTCGCGTRYNAVDATTLATCRKIENDNGVITVSTGTSPFEPGEVAANATVAIGVAFGVSGGAGAGGAAGWSVYRVYDSQGNRGYAISVQAVAGDGLGFGGSAGGYFQFTTASRIFDLQGPSVIYSSGGVAVTPWSIGGDLFGSNSYTGIDFTGGFGVGAGAYISAPGYSYTWVFADE